MIARNEAYLSMGARHLLPALQTWEAEDRSTLIVVGYMDAHQLAEHMETPVAEIQDALAELVRAGYVTRLVAFKKVVQHD